MNIRTYLRAAGAVALSAALIAVASPAQAKTWTPPEGALVTKVKATKTKTTVTYRPLKHYQTIAEDLVGSIECVAFTREGLPEDAAAAADPLTADDMLVTVEGLTITYTGRCTTTNVYIPGAFQISEGYTWDATWLSNEVKPTGVHFVPWDTDRMTLPVVPYYGAPVKKVIKRKAHEA